MPFFHTQYREAAAIVSRCGLYRYKLTRVWGLGSKRVVFVMLNPSTADGAKDDPTIRRCVAFAKAWGFDGLSVVNLFAYRATSPRELYGIWPDWRVIGPINYQYLDEALVRHPMQWVVCAWGTKGSHLKRDEAFAKQAYDKDVPLYCLKKTSSGHPSHPLYLPAHLTPILYE